MRTAKLLFRLFSSYGLSMAVLGAVFLVVLLGTYDQVDNGIYHAQSKYFDSWSFNIFDGEYVKVPFPGGLLLMSLLTINLVIGGIVNLQRTWSRIGILICHLGIVIMMAAGLVKFSVSVEGGMQLYEGESTSSFVAYHELEVTVIRNMAEGGRTEWALDSAEFRDLDSGGTRSVTLDHPDLPFQLRIDRMFSNARVEKAGLRPESDVTTPIVGGFYVMPRLTDKTAERNAAACYATAILPTSEHRGILSELAQWPWSVEVDGAYFGIKLRRRRFDLPFAVELADFDHKIHPTSGRPLSFTSDIVVCDREAGRELQKTKIAMNKPLRRDGYVLFQSSWGPSDAGPNDRLFSVFSVVKNPADQWPLIACLITTLGMSIHFGRNLFRYVRGQVRSQRGGPA